METFRLPLEKNGIILLLLIIIIIFNYGKNKKVVHKNKVIVIIPVRNRNSHLEKLLPKICSLLEYQNINYNIIIIEQKHGKLFNKGKLNNTGFLEAINIYSPKHVLFTDVDNIPMYNDTYNLELFNNILFKHYYGYSTCLGGIFSCNIETFYKVNGFSNSYWGWGQEDDDLNIRARILDIPIDRSDLLEINSYNRIIRSNQALDNGILDIETFITEREKHGSTNKPINYNRELYKENIGKYARNKYHIFIDGLNQCNYMVIKKTFIRKYRAIRILVDI